MIIKPSYPTLGRLRLGERKPTKGPGRPRAEWRFSSNDQILLAAVAERHGGTVTPWPGGSEAYDLGSDSARVPVLLPPNPLQVALEAWGSGGLSRRCDGSQCVEAIPNPQDKSGKTSIMAEGACACIRDGLIPHEDRLKGACVQTLRLNVILPDLPGLGVWLLTSHSLIAASQLSAQIELLFSLLGRTAELVPADLIIDPRSHKRREEPFARNYLIPALAVRESPRRLMALAGQQVQALESTRPLALVSGNDMPPALDPPAGVNPETGEIEYFGTRPPTSEQAAAMSVSAFAMNAFDESNETLAGPVWVRKFAAACKGIDLDDKTIGEIVYHGSDKRTRDPKAVLRAEIKGLRAAFKVVQSERVAEASYEAEMADEAQAEAAAAAHEVVA